MVPNSESGKLNMIVTVITDVILLLMMLVGLLRIRRYGGGTSSLAHLMWKQVRFSVAMASLIDGLSAPQGCRLVLPCRYRRGSTNCRFLWISFPLLSSHIYLTLQVLISLNLNGSPFIRSAHQ